MLFTYSALDQSGVEKKGTIEAVNIDIAISGLQRRGFVLSSIHPADEPSSVLEKSISIFDRVKNRDIVILSRQIATLFQAQVSALRVFRLLGTEAENPALRKVLNQVAEDLQAGAAISKAMSAHPKVFSPFYVNMVKAGEESGKLDEVFAYLADYLDRTYEVSSKARNALIYPAFVIFTFCVVMVLMLTMVIPKISTILLDSGADIPIYTKIVIWISEMALNYGIWVAAVAAIGGGFIVKFIRSSEGSESFDRFKIAVPYIGALYRKLYLSRIADNLATMLSSGIPMLRAIEITAAVVGNRAFEMALQDTLEKVRGGAALSASLEVHHEIPSILTQMIKVGEESGNLGQILNTMAKFYEREVINEVDTLVGLIEPAMIVALGVGVGVLLASVLMPIYNVASTF